MKKTKAKYNLWQNTGFMIRCAWGSCRSVLLLVVLLALTASGKAVLELLLAPAVLQRLEAGASFGALAGTIGLFTLGLLALSTLREYLDKNALYGRIEVRSGLVRRIAMKFAATSYCNTLDTRFLALRQKANRATDGNSEATEAVWTTWTEILTGCIGFAVYLAMLSDLSVWMAAAVLVTAAGGYWASAAANNWEFRHEQEQEAQEKKLQYLDGLAIDRKYAKDIRILGLRPWVEDLQRSALGVYRAFLTRQDRVHLWANAANLILTFLRNGGAYAYLIWLALNRGLPVSQFLLYIGAVGGFAQWVTGILDQFSTLHRQSLGLSEVREFLEWPEPFAFEDGEPLTVRPDHAYELRLERVCFRYPGSQKDTLHDVSLTVHPGEKLAIVGLNGAGKTTLVKLLCGFLDPTQGRVTLDGEDIRRYNRRDYYRLFAAVFQDFSLLEATIAQNVAQKMEGWDEDRVWACLDQAGLKEKISALPRGLETHLGRRVFEDGVELSGGQTQRLMLARALYKNAPVLVLDEPTAALDPIAENDIYQKYSAMTQGRTSLFISHRLASTRFCDRIVYLADGAIAEEGTHESLLALGGGYARLFEVQSQYYQEGNCHEEV